MPGLRTLAAVACLLAIGHPSASAADDTLRVATFNVSLFGARDGEILERLSKGDDLQAQAVAEIIQRVRPEVLLVNEIDYDPEGKVLAAFCDEYLAVAQNASGSPDGPAEPISYPHRYAAPSNTGVHSGLDLDRNGNVDATIGGRDYGSDCWGYGVYEGQYAFAVLSQHPIDEEAIRTFRNFVWKDMPGAQLPDDPATPEPSDWYSAEILDKLRLSSKNHCDIPIVVRGKRLHLLASHPTPPVFDGPEDRNGRRNHDELRFWADYVGPAEGSGYLVDDAQRRGGLEANAGGQRSEVRGQETEKNTRGQGPGVRSQEAESGAALRPPISDLRPPASSPSFLILGDLNSDPHDGDGGATINQLFDSPAMLKHPFPRSTGAVEAAQLQGGANARHRGDPAEDTEDPRDDPGPGNLHLDYILPSADLRVVDSGVFWPEPTDPLHPLVAGAEHPASSDHRLVWIDLAW